MTERLPYGRQWVDDDDIEAVVRVLRGDWLTTGPLVEAFEQALARTGGVTSAAAVSSGTAALHTAYAAAGLRPGQQIVTSPLTFVATATAALAVRARVCFADVDPRTGNLDPAAAEAAVGADTRLLVPVDYAGQPADYDALRAVAQRASLGLIADAAHSFGARYRGRAVGSLADATAASFHPVKAITSGEGGAVLTDDAGLAARAREFRNHGIVRDRSRHRHAGGPWYYEVQSLGLNYRIPDLLCALGLSQLGKLAGFVARRAEIAARYTAAFADVDELEVPTVLPEAESAWHLYVLRVREAGRRDAFFDALRERDIMVQLHYLPVYLHPLFEDLGYRSGLCPQAEAFAARALSIPLFPRLGDADVERIIGTVRDVAARVL